MLELMPMLGDAFAGSVGRVTTVRCIAHATAVRIKGIAWAVGRVRVGRGAVVWVTIVAKRPMEAMMAEPSVGAVMLEATMPATLKTSTHSPVKPSMSSSVKSPGISHSNLEPGDDTKGEKDRHERPQETLLPVHTNIHCCCPLSLLPLFDMALRILLIRDTPAGGHEGPQPEPLVWVSQ